MTTEEVETIQQRAQDVWMSIVVFRSVKDCGGVLTPGAERDLYTYEVRHSEIGLLLERLLGMYVVPDEETGRFVLLSPISHIVGEA